MSEESNTLGILLRKFEKQCEGKGHHWAQTTVWSDREYCQACGKTRPKEPTNDQL